MSTSTRTAIVTGAGSGIGRGVALELMKAGYGVVLAGRNATALEQTAAAGRTGAAGTTGAAGRSESLVVPTDVCDPAAVEALFARTQHHFGRLDLLFNNAGISAPPLPLEDLSPVQWHSVLNANLSGAFFCTQQAFRLMKTQRPRGGRIINNGSVSAHSPRPNSAPYTAAKHALTGLTKSTALDGRQYDIACSQIDIGNAATDMAARQTAGIEQANGSMAIEPTVDVDHIARTVVYMAGLPLAANVQFITLIATKMPFIGRG
jgi:NAD(P)-dependent dehydrogenase (short-subunit alcohol dehydrogenase family)